MHYCEPQSKQPLEEVIKECLGVNPEFFDDLGCCDIVADLAEDYDTTFAEVWQIIKNYS